MKCTIPEISWHNRDPVLSVDIQNCKDDHNSLCRLATGGTDTHVVIWYLTVKESGLASVEVVADLQRHQRAVNTVRFSPSGNFLASGDDESVIIIWKQKTDQDAPEIPGGDSEANKEQWLTLKILRGHLEDVYDLSWSSDSAFLISGSIDNPAIIWDIQKGRNVGILSEHGGFVQGVAWDPKSQYVATLSSDRICRVYNASTKKIVCKVSKATLPVPEGSELEGKVVRLFHDDTLKSFFRRLAFSPDGELLVTPAGVVEVPNSEKHFNATYIFARNDFSRPVAYLPSPSQYTVAVRFCPVLFTLRKGNSLFSLPYRMVLAIATQRNVLLYDTQQAEPFALISNIHYTRLTDLSWSSDGRTLIASSTDGYCSIITFSCSELGEVYKPPEEISQGTNDSESQKETETNKSLTPSKIKSSPTEADKLREKKYDGDSKNKTPESKVHKLGRNSAQKGKPIKRIVPISVPKTVEKNPQDTGAAAKNAEESTAIIRSSKSPQVLKLKKRITPIPISKIEKKEICDPKVQSSGLGVSTENKDTSEEKMEVDELPANKTECENKSALEMDIPKPDLDAKIVSEECALKIDIPKPELGESSARTNESAQPQELSPMRKKLISNANETTPCKPQANVALEEAGKGKGTNSAQSSNDQGTPLLASPQVEATSSNVTPISNRTPRRVQLITLASPKSKKKIL